MLNKLKSQIVFLFIRLLNATYRYEIYGSENLNQAKKNSEGGQYILAFWHQNLPASVFTQWGIPHAVIVSPSQDGQLVADTCERIGYQVARGSSSRGGQVALKKMIRLLKEMPGAITIDGPRGPSKEPKPGIFELSLLSKQTILPFVCMAEKNWVFEKSWDQMRLPKPFSRVLIHYGNPLCATKDDKKDNYNRVSQLLKKELDSLEEQINQKLNAT